MARRDEGANGITQRPRALKDVWIDADGNWRDREGNLITPVSGGGSSSSTYLGPVATRSMLPDTKHVTNKQGMFRSLHYARDNISTIQVAYANWWYDAQAENLPGGTCDWTVSIEYPVGSTPQRFLFSGVTTGTSANGATILTDALKLTTAIPSGAKFALNVWQSNSIGLVYLNNSPYLPGERAQFGLTVPDNTSVGGTGWGSANAGAMCHPVAILGETARPTAALIGDSIQRGSINTAKSFYAGNGYGDTGIGARAIGPSLAYLNLGSHGDRANTFLTSAGTRRQALVTYCSHIVCNYGINDINSAGRTPAQLITDLTTIANFWPSKPFWQMTLGLATTSTDAFATSANQTVGANEGNLTSFNATLRGGVSFAAGVFDIRSAQESAYLSGLWKAPSWTTDGIHYTVFGQCMMAMSGAINPALLVR